MEYTGSSEIAGAIISVLVSIAGAAAHLKAMVSRLEQQANSLSARLKEHKLNHDAHVTRELIQQLGARSGGPTDREWGEHVNEMKEVRHDLRNLTATVRALGEGGRHADR